MTESIKDMGGCQNCGPFLGTRNIRCRIIIGTQKGTIILTSMHIPELRGIGLLEFTHCTCRRDYLPVVSKEC